MKANNNSLLKQIDEVEFNLRRLRTLIEVDLVYTPNANVSLYCTEKIILQTQNIQREISGIICSATNMLIDECNCGSDHK